MKFLPLLLCSLVASLTWAAEPAELPLWPKAPPGLEGNTSLGQVNTAPGGGRTVTLVDMPSILPFLPAKESANGCAVLVIPGGGHRILCVDHEGDNVARWLQERGFAAFVLRYRLAREPGSVYTIEEHAVPDTQRALRTIRSRAVEWGIDPQHVGAIGFSAGGELVNFASIRPGAGDPQAADLIERESAVPSFQAMIYPGTSGKIEPTKTSPPAFLACGEKDRQDIAEGLAEAYLRFKRAGASAELHVYAGVGHGFGVRPNMTGPVAGWSARFAEWLTAGGFTSAKKP